MAAEPGGLAGWALSIMDAAGAAGAAAVVGLENLFPPIPSEAVLPLAGFAAGQGRFGVVEVIAWTTLGSTAGALLLYLLGATLGLDRLRRLAGSGIWNSAFILAGYSLGRQWHRVEPYAGTASGIVLLLAVVAIAGLVIRRVRALRADEAQAPPVGSRRPPV